MARRLVTDPMPETQKSAVGDQSATPKQPATRKAATSQADRPVAAKERNRKATRRPGSDRNPERAASLNCKFGN